MKKRFFYLLLPIVTIVLEILPYGAVLNFANPEGEPWRETYSYFSLVPYGYANFAPLITAIITCIIFVILLIYCFTGKSRTAINARNLLCICAVISLGPLMFGIRSFSVVGALITISLVAEWLLIHFTIKNSETRGKLWVEKTEL